MTVIDALSVLFGAGKIGRVYLDGMLTEAGRVVHGSSGDAAICVARHGSLDTIVWQEPRPALILTDVPTVYALLQQYREATGDKRASLFFSTAAAGWICTARGYGGVESYLSESDAVVNAICALARSVGKSR